MKAWAVGIWLAMIVVSILNGMWVSLVVVTLIGACVIYVYFKFRGVKFGGSDNSTPPSPPR